MSELGTWGMQGRERVSSVPGGTHAGQTPGSSGEGDAADTLLGVGFSFGLRSDFVKWEHEQYLRFLC